MTSMAKVKWILALIGLLLVVILALLNRAPVTLDLVFWKPTMSRLILFPALFLAGLIIGIALGWGFERKRGRAARTPGAPQV